VTKVLIVDDHPIVLQGCTRVLQDAGVGDIHEASTVAAAYRLYRRMRPDVIIADLALQGNKLGGLDLISRIRGEDRRVPILVLSMHNDPFIVRRALEAGATGYVLKDAGPHEFLDAFGAVSGGRPYLNHEMALQVAMLSSHRSTTPLGDLSPRELQAFTLLAEGKPYHQIARDLNVSYKTVANIGSQLKAKLGAQNLPELIRMAIQYASSSTDQSPRISETETN